MQRGELKPVLKELRKVRCGTERPDRVPAPLVLYMGHGIGHLCDLLASWLEGDTVDRRAADATIRFYGLGRMPEPISSIAATLRAHDDGRSLSVRQVENLIAAALTRAEGRDPIVRVNPSAHQVAKPCDPFPLPLDGAQKRCLAKVLLWAWADVVGPPGPDGSSLMLYEQEHGLRAEAPQPGTRPERQRWRRRAWAMLDVAQYRVSEAVPTDPVVDRALGPRHLAVVDKLPSDGLDALLILGIDPRAGDFHEALAIVRAAVRAGRPEAPELLGLVRDAVNRSRGVPPDVTSKVLALAAIVARERRDPAGVVAGEQALLHAADVLGERQAEDVGQIGLTVASDALRASQESAELSYALGDFARGWRTIRAMRNALETFGDPERESEPGGWLQQWLLYSASAGRRLARWSRRPRNWLDEAGVAADRSADLVFTAGILPTSWGLAAREQRLGVTVDLAEQALIHRGPDDARKMLRPCRRRVEELEADWLLLSDQKLSDDDKRHVRVGLLGTARAVWRIALLAADRDAVFAARQLAWSRVGQWTSPTELDKLAELESAGRLLGIEPESEPPTSGLARSLFQDRGDIRRTTTIVPMSSHLQSGHESPSSPRVHWPPIGEPEDPEVRSAYLDSQL